MREKILRNLMFELSQVQTPEQIQAEEEMPFSEKIIPCHTKK